jgi:hypothetical protein
MLKCKYENFFCIIYLYVPRSLVIAKSDGYGIQQQRWHACCRILLVDSQIDPSFAFEIQQ